MVDLDRSRSPTHLNRNSSFFPFLTFIQTPESIQGCHYLQILVGLDSSLSVVSSLSSILPVLVVPPRAVMVIVFVLVAHVVPIEDDLLLQGIQHRFRKTKGGDKDMCRIIPPHIDLQDIPMMKFNRLADHERKMVVVVTVIVVVVVGRPQEVCRTITR